MKPVRLAIADHSLFVREAVARLLSNEPRISVVGQAASGEELLSNLERWRPDVITLELSLPGMNGLATLDNIMTSRPTPVVIFSTHTGEDAPLTIEALHRGAVDFIDKEAYSLVDFQALRQVLVEKILGITVSEPPPSQTAAAGAKGAADLPARQPPARSAPASAPAPRPGSYDIIVIGASTGGPPAIEQILHHLGSRVSVPVAVVQHMPQGFTRAFADRLDNKLPLQVKEAVDGERLLPATVRIAPAGAHLKIGQNGGSLVSVVTRSSVKEVHRPSVDIFFASTAKAIGARAVAVLLSGMGRDGAQGLAELAAKGAHTIAQDEASSAVYGMPRAAVELNAVCEVLPVTLIGNRLRKLLGGGGGGGGEPNRIQPV